MDQKPSTENQTPAAQPVEAEVLQPRSEVSPPSQGSPSPSAAQASVNSGKPVHRSYRPSHKATLLGLSAVILILAINAVIFGVVLKKQSSDDNLASKGQITISTKDLNKLGINRTSLGSSGVKLLVAPDAQFKGKLSVSGSTDIAGQVVLNGKLTGTDATLNQLQAGNTSLTQLNVNGDGTLSTLNLRKDLVVAGVTRLQGAATLSALLTVTNNVNVTGNLAVGGVLSAKTFSIQSLNISGHLASSGPTPNIGPGPALGSNGTVSISGNDTAGTIAINIGAGASGGTLANLAFKTQYSSAPKVVVSSVGIGGEFYLSGITTAGFSVAVMSGLPPGGYRLNYIVVQ